MNVRLSQRLRSLERSIMKFSRRARSPRGNATASTLGRAPTGLRATVDISAVHRELVPSRAATEPRGRRYDASVGLARGGDVVSAAQGGVVEAGRDIARREEAEEAVYKSQLEERNILEALPAGAWQTDPVGRTRFVNRHWLEYTGLQRADFAGRGWLRAIHPDDRREVIATCTAACRRRPANYQVNYRARRRDGAYRWHLAEVRPQLAPDGTVSGWVAVAIDMHDLKEGEQHVRQLYDEARTKSEQLQHANESKDELLGLISHELKTPITTIIGNAEVLLKHARQLDDDRRASALEDIQAEAGHLHQIVDELLSLSRIERGQEVELEPLLLGHLLERIIAEHRVRYPARAFELDVRTDTPALGESLYVGQVVRNFLSNAEKYSPTRSTVTASVRRVGDEIEVAVSDRGSGISEDEVTRVFMPFVRLERTAMQANGMGIGLAVCKRLIEAQSGRIWARPHEGGGSEFGFALRAVEDDLDPRAADDGERCAIPDD